jgi:hypothetical protein
MKFGILFFEFSRSLPHSLFSSRREPNALSACLFESLSDHTGFLCFVNDLDDFGLSCCRSSFRKDHHCPFTGKGSRHNIRSGEPVCDLLDIAGTRRPHIYLAAL